MIKAYVGYSNDETIRYKATSGGVGSSIIKYLFENQIIHTSISFDYDKETLQYVPKLIYKYEDYKITGSIYHEVKLIKFIKEHLNEIKGGFACFVLPCQAAAIRAILNKAGIASVLIGLTCSSQQSIEATYYLLRRLHIKKSEIEHIQYRGNGWPSGIQILLKNQTTRFVPNNNSIWTQIFHSRLFIQKRCFNCNNTLNDNSDIALADPWLSCYIKNEKTGITIVMCNSGKGIDLIKKLIDLKYINLYKLQQELVLRSQEYTINRKNKYLKNINKVKVLQKIFSFPLYRRIVLGNSLLFESHNKILRLIESKYLK